MDTTVTDALVGRVLEGRYAIQSRIARGGMATVYLAVDQRLDREVAIKVMHADLARDEDFLRRFVREARSAARLSHPGIVAVYDQGEDDGHVFLVMEHVPGRTLRDLLTEQGSLSPRAALTILDPVLDALSAAHWNGIIHRDVKPENVLLADDGRVKVADFGLARAASTATSSQDSKVLLGTVAYLAPEQVERGVADARSDVYAVGILLFEMLTGRKPFTGETPLQVAYQHVHSGVPAPSTVVPGLAPELDLLVGQATARDPDDRPADASELLVAARQTRAGLTTLELDTTFPAVAQAGDQTVLVPSLGPSASPGAGAIPAPALAPTGVLDLTGPPGTGRVPAVGTPAGGANAPTGKVKRSRRPRRRGRTAAIVILVVVALLGAAGWYVGAGPGSKIATPNVVGHPVADAQKTLQAKGLSSRVHQVFSETVPAGQVVSSDPGAGDAVSKHGTVTLNVSKGLERYPVPDVTGKSTAAAEAAITGAHLTIGPISTQYDDNAPQGRVLSVDPEAGTQLKPGTPISLKVSDGPAPVELADWTGKPIDQASSSLQGAGLTVKTTEKYSMKVADGLIINQTPGAGTAHRGDTVNFVVSKGPPLVDVPDVVGKSQEEATQILEGDGFKVSVRNWFGGVLDQVRFQDPGGDRQAPRGSTVTITIV